MPLENLSNKLTATFRNIVGKGKLSDKNMDAMLQDIRVALLEADVNYSVVTLFLESIKENFRGAKVNEALDPSQMVLKIVHSQLVKLLGESESTLRYKLNGLTTILIVGLQGSGKTTAAAKIADFLNKKQQRKTLLIAGDVVRPAAIQQLEILAQGIPAEVFTLGTEISSYETIKKGLAYGKEKHYDTVIIDTAGRLHIDKQLMQELTEIAKLAKPDEILLTADAMSGQDIVNVAMGFKEKLELSGLIATKFDGDSRGGGILSVKAVTDVPIKFVSAGEKLTDLEIFYPERMADRILGMGDLLTLVEQAEEKLDQQVNQRAMQRLLSGEFNLNDMLQQIQQVRKMGPLAGLLKMMPGMGELASGLDEEDTEKSLNKQLAILHSMTEQERDNPQLLRTSRKARVAKGSGTTLEDVTKLLSNFEKTKKQMEMLTKMAQRGDLPDFSTIFKQ